MLPLPLNRNHARKASQCDLFILVCTSTVVLSRRCGSLLPDGSTVPVADTDRTDEGLDALCLVECNVDACVVVPFLAWAVTCDEGVVVAFRLAAWDGD